jgi:hypothetical protein
MEERILRLENIVAGLQIEVDSLNLFKEQMKGNIPVTPKITPEFNVSINGTENESKNVNNSQQIISQDNQSEQDGWIYILRCRDNHYFVHYCKNKTDISILLASVSDMKTTDMLYIYRPESVIYMAHHEQNIEKEIACALIYKTNRGSKGHKVRTKLHATNNLGVRSGYFKDVVENIANAPEDIWVNAREKIKTWELGEGVKLDSLDLVESIGVKWEPLGLTVGTKK